MRQIMISLAAAFLGSGAWAQPTVNPAMTAPLENGFVRVGEIVSTSRNNIGAAAFLFPRDGKLVTGLHPSISDEVFLGGINAVNSLYGQLDYNLVSYGWKNSRPGFHTVDVAVRGNYGLSVPREIFRILKTGTARSPYDLSSFRAFGNLYGEISYGYSRQINDKLAAGGRVKLLAGLNSAEISARKFELATTDEEYRIDLDADIDLTNRNRKVGEDGDGYLDYSSIMGKGKLGTPTGAGLAVDLGLVWKPIRNLSLSASLLDLGGILWYYGNGGKSSGSYSFQGLKDLATDEFEEEKMAAKLKETGEEFLKVIKPKTVKDCFKLKPVPLTARLGADYGFPFCDRLSASCSFLYTGYRYCTPYWEARGGLALDIPGIARISASAGGSSYGFVYGAGGSVDFLQFRLYARYESGAGGTIPYESIPLKANSKSLVIGLVYMIRE